MSKGMNERRKFDSRDGSYLQTVCVKDRHSSESLKVCVGWESLKLVVRAYKMQAGLINFGKVHCACSPPLPERHLMGKAN